MDPFTAFQSLPERRETTEDLFVNAVIARWALVETSDEPLFGSIVKTGETIRCVVETDRDLRNKFLLRVVLR